MTCCGKLLCSTVIIPATRIHNPLVGLREIRAQHVPRESSPLSWQRVHHDEYAHIATTTNIKL
jgi:hypothetical protein